MFFFNVSPGPSWKTINVYHKSIKRKSQFGFWDLPATHSMSITFEQHGFQQKRKVQELNNITQSTEKSDFIAINVKDLKCLVNRTASMPKAVLSYVCG